MAYCTLGRLIHRFCKEITQNEKWATSLPRMVHVLQEFIVEVGVLYAHTPGARLYGRSIPRGYHSHFTTEFHAVELTRVFGKLPSLLVVPRTWRTLEHFAEHDVRPNLHPRIRRDL